MKVSKAKLKSAFPCYVSCFLWPSYQHLSVNYVHASIPLPICTALCSKALWCAGEIEKNKTKTRQSLRKNWLVYLGNLSGERGRIMSVCTLAAGPPSDNSREICQQFVQLILVFKLYFHSKHFVYPWGGAPNLSSCRLHILSLFARVFQLPPETCARQLWPVCRCACLCVLMVLCPSMFTRDKVPTCPGYRPVFALWPLSLAERVLLFTTSCWVTTKILFITNYSKGGVAGLPTQTTPDWMCLTIFTFRYLGAICWPCLVVSS